jgi:hypothetical protein
MTGGKNETALTVRADNTALHNKTSRVSATSLVTQLNIEANNESGSILKSQHARANNG